jgi:tRNA 2-thiouridine synthesizing protein E
MNHAARQAYVADRLEDLQRDEEGFLLDPSDWSTDLIEPLAAESGLPMTEERSTIIRYIRDYYEMHQSVPEARVVLRHMQEHWGRDKATRRYLYQLFPRGYGQQACKIAGMRKPRKLMLDV